MAPRKPVSRFKRSFRGLLSIIVAVVVVELFLRSINLPLVAPSDFVAGKDANRSFPFDFGTMWRFPQNPSEKWGPSARDEFGNRYGCRGYEPAAKKARGDLRIICVGASGVSGFAMPFGWSFGILLERQLQRDFPGARVETVLAGIAGFSSEQQRALLQGKLDAFEPDLVIFLSETHNDIELAGERRDQENLDRLRPGFSRTWDLLRFKYKFINDLAHVGNQHDGNSEVSAAKSRVPLPRFVENMTSMLTWVKNKGATPLVILSAVAEGDFAKTKYRGEVEKLVRQLRVASIDLSTVAAHRSDWLDPIHLSMTGHENLARALRRLVKEKDLLASSKSRISQSAPNFEISHIEPSEITIGQNQVVRLQLAGVKQGDLSRVWCGGLLTRFAWLKDATLELTLPRLMPARPASIELVTSHGSRIFQDVIQIHPPKLSVDLATDGSMTFEIDLPEAVEIAFVATVQPKENLFATKIGPLVRAQGQSWPPPVDQDSAFYKDHVFLHGTSLRQGLWRKKWQGGPALPSGTSIAIQGLLAIPSPGDFVPISLTTPMYLTVP